MYVVQYRSIASVLQAANSQPCLSKCNVFWYYFWINKISVCYQTAYSLGFLPEIQKVVYILDVV